MPRTVNVELMEKKNAVINDVLSFIRANVNHTDKVKVDRFYHNTGADEIWRTRAYFVQELKKACPPDIKFISKRRVGTFAVKNDDVIVPDITITKSFKKVVFKGTVVDNIPASAHEIRSSDYAKAFKEMDDIKAVYKDNDEYFVLKNDDTIIHYVST